MRKIFTYYLSILLLLACACNKPESEVSSQINEILNLRIKSSHGLIVGKPIKIFPELSSKKKYNCLIALENGLVVKTYNCASNKILNIPGKELAQAGRYTIKAYIENELMATRTINLVSDEIIHPLYINTGPKKIIVNGKQESMITIIPSDSFNNAIVTQPDFTFSDSKQKENSTSLQNLISSNIYTSDSKEEKLLVGVSKENVSSREQAIYYTADWPTKFKIEILQHIPYADNRQYLNLKTSLVTDENGNTVANGTRIVFTVRQDRKLYATYNSVVIDGYATVYIRNPKKACKWKIEAQVHNSIKSNSISINFDSIVDKINYKIKNGFKQIKVGPVNSVLGQTIPDGTEILIHINDKKISKQSRIGVATFDISNYSEITNLKIEISGVLESIPIND